MYVANRDVDRFVFMDDMRLIANCNLCCPLDDDPMFTPVKMLLQG